jgi:4-hydroxybenzoate polyprenyltransferase
VRALLELARPEQWIKNGFVLLPLIFGQAAGNPDSLRGAILATLAFCLL